LSQLVQALLELAESLQSAPGTPAGALESLLISQAVSTIQRDPAQSVTDESTPPLVRDAIRRAADQAGTLSASGIHRGLERQEFPPTETAGSVSRQVFETYGPFVDRSGTLVQYAAFESASFLAVHLRPPSAPIPLELWLLVPLTSKSAAADNSTWNLPGGTVWVNARFLVGGTPGFVGLRISSGTLKFDRPIERSGSRLLAPSLTVWTLSLEPEQPAPGDAAASDADAIALTLPTRLDIHSNASPQITGSAALSGFGSDLHFTPSPAAPFLDGQQICLPVQASESEWTIAGNKSSTIQFSGSGATSSSSWAFGVSSVAANLLGEAAHGGSVSLRLTGLLEAKFASQQDGPFRCFVNVLTANGRSLEVKALQVDSKGRYEFAEWTTSTTTLRFRGQAIGQLTFRSERGAHDTTAVSGGLCSNRWDLPRRADGAPFPFEGLLDLFVVVATPMTQWMACTAASDVQSERAALALENLYLVVRPPRRLLLLAGFDQAPRLPDGTALLFFDVNIAIPTLPDPYAANLGLPRSDVFAENALRITLTWSGANTPVLSASLNSPVRFPELRLPAPADEDESMVYSVFQQRLASRQESFYLLDMSGNENLFGVALEAPSEEMPQLLGNRLAVRLERVRLLMQPQVQWEPVHVEPGPVVAAREVVHSSENGGPTLIGANAVTLVPVLPTILSREIVRAVHGRQPGAALFSLPFGLRAVAFLSQADPPHVGDIRPGTDVNLHEPTFGDLRSARQVRLTARNTKKTDDPSRYMPGRMRQLKNLELNAIGLTSVIPTELLGTLNGQFTNVLPLHQADLSGYGLSAFSEWVLEADGAGVNKVHFEVVNGRTAYEVIQFRSVLYECGARVVRTIILERHNSGRVLRADTGWVAIEAGQFLRPEMTPFEKGALASFQNIRRIRIVGDVIRLDADSAVQPVIFDGDAEVGNVIGGGPGGLLPFYDRPGYIQVQPPPPAPLPPAAPPYLSSAQVRLLFERVGPISGPIDGKVRFGKTLETQLSSIVSDLALDDGGGTGYAAALVGTNRLPHAGQWSVMRIDPNTGEVSPVDPHRGTPVVQNSGEPFRFREPSDARRTPRIEYGFLMATESSRVLFSKPIVDPGRVGKVLFDSAPIVADPYSLVQSTGFFPRAPQAFQVNETPGFDVSSDNQWKIDNPFLTVAAPPLGDLLKGGDWGVNRSYRKETLNLFIDSTVPAVFNVQAPTSDLDLTLPDPLGKILNITTKYTTVAGGLPKLDKPDLAFTGALKDVTDVLHALSQFTGLPFNFDVSVSTAGGASPAFVVHLQMIFRLGTGPDDRVDIGVGKFYGQFLAQGALQVGLSGVQEALLFLELRGDVQQGIIPPLLYAGGLFRFGIELQPSGSPVIQLVLGVVASIGGDLIKGLLEVEVTVSYGYTLIPETLQPGVLLGLEARAKLLGGLVGFSFSAEAMARIQRASPKSVTVWAQIHVAASVQVAIFVEEDVDFQTQFQQDIPLAALALVPGVGLLPAATLLT